MSKTQPTLDAPVLRQDEPLALFWNKNVSELATVKLSPINNPEAERHKIYSLALMTLVQQYWNGNKRGTSGDYPWRPKQQWLPPDDRNLYRIRPAEKDDDRESDVRDYLGHNIAALAVDGDGDIIDFEFNHNEVFCSSVEHAESRLIRRIFSLGLIGKGWNLAGMRSTSRPATNLSNVTLYTSLEPCAQCAGIMTLAGVKEVIYLQKDFGMYCIANILYNLTNPGPIPAPRPIPANHFGFRYYDTLNEEFKEFYTRVVDPATPFWKDNPTRPQKVDKAQAVTSFLCTDNAYEIYKAAATEFRDPKLLFSDFTPPPAVPAPEGATTGEGQSNRRVWENACQFVDGATKIARRGTPHQL